MKIFDKSTLWDSILKTTAFQKIDIKTFKEDGINTRISQYNHKTHGLLFLKNLLFQMAGTLGTNNLSLLNNIPNRHLGGGININYDNIQVDLDYLLALEEVIFLKEKLGTVNSILEIGAGYGRTCHTLLSLFPNIKQYHIIDLPDMLALSRSYLNTVSNVENFSKIYFICVDDIPNNRYDLIINIDSMQEMSQKTAESYLKYINDQGQAFYSKNTVGKFDPGICGWQNSEASNLAMNSGILKELVNIFCPIELKKAQERFLFKFLPSKDWSIKSHGPTLPWSHYYQALFIKNV